MKGPAVEWQEEGQSSTGGEGCRMRETPDSRSRPGGHRCSVGGELEAQLGSTGCLQILQGPTPSPAEDSSAHSHRGTGHGDLDLTQLHSLH